jgi:hypothetical protein
MTLHWWLGLSALIAIIALVIFTFRQGLKVKPDTTGNSHDSMGGGVGGGGQ